MIIPPLLYGSLAATYPGTGIPLSPDGNLSVAAPGARWIRTAVAFKIRPGAVGILSLQQSNGGEYLTDAASSAPGVWHLVQSIGCGVSLTMSPNDFEIGFSLP